MFFRVLLLALIVCLEAGAATIQANSPSRNDVAAATSAAVTGDTVLVPAGTAIWTNNVLITGKGITLRGAGTNLTIIVDGNTNARTSQPSLLDIIWQGTNGGMFDLSGFQFKGATNATASLIVGMVRLKASDNMTNDSVWRVHNNWWNDPYGRPAMFRAWSGLIDSNTFSLTHHLAGISIDNRIQSGEQGDRSWAVDPPAGTTNLVYFEHNRIDATGTPRAITDAFAGARYVARYNNVRNRSFENHGTESTQRARSARWMEIYGNTMLQDGGAGEYATLIRGGSGVICSNTLTGPWPGLLRSLYVLSFQSHSPWTMANGTNVWDVNVGGGPFETGTHTGADGATDLLDASKTWSVNQWQGYNVINYSQSYTNPVGVQHRAGLITDNTANSIGVLQTAIANQILRWTNGDSYMIWKVSKALDAMGRGTGDLLVGGSSSVPPTPVGFPNQVDDPVYLWANTGATNVAVGQYPLIEGRDWTNGVARSGYVPLVDPHPLASGTNPPAPPLPPTLLAFGQQPTSAAITDTIVPPVTVFIENDNGEVVTTSSAPVTIAISANPSAGTLSGTLIQVASSGVATFNDLSIDLAGAGYSLAVTSPGLAGRTSGTFDITSAVGVPTQLIVAQEPTSSLTNAVIAPPITVKIADAAGVQTASTANVIVSIGTNPSGGTLSGTLTNAAVSGLATFNDLIINNAGTNYTLAFTSVGLTSTNSAQFNIFVTPPVPPPIVKRPPGPLRILL